MYYFFDICPKCKDKLYEREWTEDEEKYYDNFSEVRCPHCGNRLINACMGEKKPDDTVYKIFLTSASAHIDNKMEICIEVLMEIGHCDRKSAIEKLDAEDIVICEGKISEIYFAIKKLQEAEGRIQYRIEPEFPYMTLSDPEFFFCQTCEGIAIYKTEELADNPSMVKSGTFCEHCNKWIAYTVVSKDSLDVDTEIL